MEKTVEEYKQQFFTETIELIVRISWSMERGNFSFEYIDNYHLERARFDVALDVSTGKLLENKGFNWLDWLVPNGRTDSGLPESSPRRNDSGYTIKQVKRNHRQSIKMGCTSEGICRRGAA